MIQMINNEEYDVIDTQKSKHYLRYQLRIISIDGFRLGWTIGPSPCRSFKRATKKGGAKTLSPPAVVYTVKPRWSELPLFDARKRTRYSMVSSTSFSSTSTIVCWINNASSSTFKSGWVLLLRFCNGRAIFLDDDCHTIIMYYVQKRLCYLIYIGLTSIYPPTYFNTLWSEPLRLPNFYYRFRNKIVRKSTSLHSVPASHHNTKCSILYS